ncbi:MAG: hypothetical protein EOO74_05020 [Myxococcales bacterium]|nr:MAG: hypothetical protein EOO74_05020 [Myxococcales bacterium]
MGTSANLHAEVYAVAPSRGLVRSFIADSITAVLESAARDLTGLGLSTSETKVEAARAICASMLAQLHQGNIDRDSVITALERTLAAVRAIPPASGVVAKTDAAPTTQRSPKAA